MSENFNLRKFPALFFFFAASEDEWNFEIIYFNQVSKGDGQELKIEVEIGAARFWYNITDPCNVWYRCGDWLIREI